MSNSPKDSGNETVSVSSDIWSRTRLRLDGTEIKVSLLRKGNFENYDRDGLKNEDLLADAEAMLGLCDKVQTAATEKPDPTLEKIQRLAIRVVSNDGCDLDLKMLAAQVLVETQREKMEKTASERVVEFTSAKTMSGEAVREALGYPPVSEKDLSPSVAKETKPVEPSDPEEKMVPLKEMASLLGYIERRIYARAGVDDDERVDPRDLVDPILVAAYDRAAKVAGWPTSFKLFAARLVGVSKPIVPWP